jgi:hypothetical protein
LTRILGIGCGLLAFATFCGVGLSLSAIFAVFSAETDAASGFLADVRRDDWASALARTSSEYQSHHTASDLASRVAAIEALDHHGVAFLTSAEEVDEHRARVEGSLYGSGGETPIAFELSESGGYWYIDLVVVRGVRLE